MLIVIKPNNQYFHKLLLSFKNCLSHFYENHLKPPSIFLLALRRLRATNQIEEDIEEMRAEERAQQSEATISMMELVCSPTLRQPLIISVVMQLSQQLSGINAVSIVY